LNDVFVIKRNKVRRQWRLFCKDKICKNVKNTFNCSNWCTLL